MFKFWKKISIISALTTAPLLIPAVSHAGLLNDLGTGVFSGFTIGLEWFTQMVGYAISYVTSQLIAFAAYFIQLMIQMSIHIMESPLIHQGFTITLSFANLGFTLAIIFISFITIFRLQGYETKKLLRNLIVAAVLINFSFTFAGLVMDASHVFSGFFINAIAGDTKNLENITLSIGNSLNIQKLNGAPPTADALQAAGDAGNAYIRTIASISLNIFYNSMIVITFFVLAGMMIIRYVTISILLIIMPFAWLCWIFPGLNKYWSMWWDEFKKWNIFLPVLMFFIYISLLTSTGIKDAVKAATSGLTSAAAAGGFSGSTTDLIRDIAAGIVQVGILFGGLMVAQKMGIAGSAAISKGTNAVKGWVTGGAIGFATGKYAAKAGLAVAGGESSGKIKDLAQGTANLINKSRILSSIPGSSGAITALNKFASRKGDIDDYQKKNLSELTEDQWKIAARRTPKNVVQQAAFLAEAIKRKDINALTAGAETADDKKKLLRMFGDAAKATNNKSVLKEVVAMDPTLAPEFLGKEVGEFVKEARPDKAAEWKPEVLGSAGVAENISRGAIAKIVAENSEDHIQALQQSLKNSLSGTGSVAKAIGDIIQESTNEITRIEANIADLNEKIEISRDKDEKTRLQDLKSREKEDHVNQNKRRKKALESATDNQKKAFSQIQLLKETTGDAGSWKPKK